MSKPTPATSEKPATRTSVRHSFNLSSMTKALADVMKDSRDMGASKANESSSRRPSAVAVLAPSNGPRNSLGDGKGSLKKPPTAPNATSPPSSKTVTRKTRASVPADVSVDELGLTTDSAKLPRVATLRPRPQTRKTSLPKYRPKSMVLEVPKKESTPTRARAKRKPSDGEGSAKEGTTADESSAAMALRPISPLPKRAIRKGSAADVLTTAGTPPPGQAAGASPRVLKQAKHSPGVVRPPSSSSRQSPSTPTRNKSLSQTAFNPKHGQKHAVDSRTPSPIRITASISYSPLPHGSKNNDCSIPTLMKKTSTKTVTSSNTTLLGDSSTDSLDEASIEYLLGEAIPPGAPTPALPRLRSTHQRQASVLRTPTRGSQLRPPSKSNSHFLSPAHSIQSTPSRHPSTFAASSPDNRTSILSWKEFAHSSQTVPGNDESEGLLEVLAPFRPDIASPTLSELRLDIHIPDSPVSSGLPSPVGYTSISQVLLPDATPSPAVHSRRSFEVDPAILVENNTVTLLRLQVAAVEKQAKDRLLHILTLEDDLAKSKAARASDERELETEVSRLEEQMRLTLSSHSSAENDYSKLVASLKEELERTRSSQRQIVQEAVVEALLSRELVEQKALRSQRIRLEAISTAQRVVLMWDIVRDVADSELPFVHSSRQTLATLLCVVDGQRTLLRHSA